MTRRGIRRKIWRRHYQGAARGAKGPKLLVGASGAAGARDEPLSGPGADLASQLQPHLRGGQGERQRAEQERILLGLSRVSGVPHFYVLDARGKLLESFNTGLLEKEKSYDEAKFGKFIAFFQRQETCSRQAPP